MKIIDDFTNKKLSIEDVLSHVGDGWHPIVRKLIEDLEKAGWDGRLSQIKEKFGGLRFYISQSYKKFPELYRLIAQAETDSLEICEICGEPGSGTSSGGYWVKTLCEAHDEERKAAREAGR